ncbi:acylphosphatase [Globicatella sulfidifaciens]|mgnify:CR=1 FL=1|uniref:acylphosphatase n=1 Tax=Globicatella sulfidifaciens TaxID=136093 RepID=A0A7X8GZ03_9LACT|nr:acylphosphatase [Globicatella sulfidifaciens]NLJ17289.1 acylphosphatase [Globicatella sulfidifaciens]
MHTFELIFKGNVQGVGFRYHVYQCALKSQVKGFVKNLNDGTVKAIVQTTENSIDCFIDEVFNTPYRLIKIDKIDINEITPTETYQDFSIHY